MEGGEKMTSGVYERKPKRKGHKHSEEYKRMMSDNFSGRKIINGHWTERKEDKMNGCDEKENSLHEEYKPRFFGKTFEFLEERKQNKHISVDVVNKFKVEAKTLDEAFQLDEQNMANRHQNMVNDFNEKIISILEEADAKKHEPVKKSWIVRIKAEEEKTKEYEEMLTKMMEQARIIFPEAKISIKLCGEKWHM